MDDLRKPDFDLVIIIDDAGHLYRHLLSQRYAVRANVARRQARQVALR